MSVFVTGATGFLGSYVANLLLEEHDERLSLLVRAADRDQAVDKLWRALQLHMDAERFYALLPRIDFVYGDLHAPDLGLADDVRERLVRETSSVLHIAASLNRKSEKACLNTNLRGTLSVVKLARAMADHGGLRRFSQVSTVAVAGERDSEVVGEDEAIDWGRSDYDPYARTKKFCEHMAAELLPDVPRTVFRPSITMGDSRFSATTQFDMVRAFCLLAELPVVPLSRDARLDIVNADFVGRAIADLHMKDAPEHTIYHLASGTDSPTTGEVADAMSEATGRRLRFAPALERPFERLVDTLAGSRRKNAVTLVGSLLKVFLPYITYDTVFDNRRVTEELGLHPTPFTDYCADLYRFAKGVDYRYPYEDLPPRAEGRAA